QRDAKAVRGQVIAPDAPQQSGTVPPGTPPTFPNRSVLGVPGRARAAHVVPFRMIAVEHVPYACEQVGELAEQAAFPEHRLAGLCHLSLLLARSRPRWIS